MPVKIYTRPKNVKTPFMTPTKLWIELIYALNAMLYANIYTSVIHFDTPIMNTPSISTCEFLLELK